MAHGGYGKRRVAGRPPLSGPGRGGSRAGLGVRHKESEKKAKIVSIKNQIRSIERLLKKALPVEMKDAQQKKLEDLRKQADLHARSELERKMALRYRKVKFFERRKIERAIRRLEKLQRAATDHPLEDTARPAADIALQLAQLKEDLEYVRFFPKTEKYVSLFMGNDDENLVTRRKALREQIRANLAAAAAAGMELEETGSEDEGAVELSEDEFFLVGSSSDDADADDEWTDKSPRPGDDRDDTSREVVPTSPRTGVQNTQQQQQRSSKLASVSRTSGKALRTTWSDNERNQRQKSARALMPPPRTPSYPSSSNSGGRQSRSWHSGHSGEVAKGGSRPSSNSEEFGRTGNHPSSSNSWEILKASTRQASNGSSNSDAQQKPRRKRSRPKKKKKQQ